LPAAVSVVLEPSATLYGPPAATNGGSFRNTRTTDGSWSEAWSKELRVDVHRVEDERAREQRPAEENVVEHLGVALELVAVALVRRQSVHQIVQAGALEDPDGIGELEVVQIAEHDDARSRVRRRDVRDEVGHEVCLLVPLGLRCPRRRLEAAAQRVVAHPSS
jgi:hypothetical protein